MKRVTKGRVFIIQAGVQWNKLKGYKMFDVKKLLVLAALVVGLPAMASQKILSKIEQKEITVEKSDKGYSIKIPSEVMEGSINGTGLVMGGVYTIGVPAEGEDNKNGKMVITYTSKNKESETSTQSLIDRWGPDRRENISVNLISVLAGRLCQEKKEAVIFEEKKTDSNELQSEKKDKPIKDDTDCVRANKFYKTCGIMASVALVALVADQLCETNYFKTFVTKCYKGLKSVVAKKSTVE